MKIKGSLVFSLISLAASLPGFSQNRPSNDNLSNATVLTGMDVTFNGSLKGATLEGSADANGDDWTTPTGSIWWSWTAPVSTVLNLEPQPFQFDYENANDGLTVYAATNGTTNPAGLLQPFLGSTMLYPNVAYQSLSIPVTAGSNYFIQLVGNSTNYSYTFRLQATNAPLILKQPLSQTVYSNNSTLFYVVSGGLQPRTFQWYYNGTPLPGETAPILAFNNIDSSIAGNYSVLVSNVTGSVMSDMATLSISPSNIPPTLTALGQSSNTLSFSLSGETGRAYHIQSSSNLVDWTPENSFPVAPHAPSTYTWHGDIVFTTNSSLTLNVTGHSSSKFYRASIQNTNSADSEICINNLRQITVAKYLWMLDTKTNYSTTTPIASNLAPYFAHLTNIYCPLDPDKMFLTSYWINSLDVSPECDIEIVIHQLDHVP